MATEREKCCICTVRQQMCDVNCRYRLYFPQHMKTKFDIISSVFCYSELSGLITKAEVQVADLDRHKMVDSLLLEATERRNDPVRGIAGRYWDLKNEEQRLEAEVDKWRTLFIQLLEKQSQQHCQLIQPVQSEPGQTSSNVLGAGDLNLVNFRALDYYNLLLSGGNSNNPFITAHDTDHTGGQGLTVEASVSFGGNLGFQRDLQRSSAQHNVASLLRGCRANVGSGLSGRRTGAVSITVAPANREPCDSIRREHECGCGAIRTEHECGCGRVSQD